MKIYEHEIRMARSSQATIEQMVRERQLVFQKQHGFSYYVPSRELLGSIYPIDDTTLVIGRTVIQSDLYRLPMAEATAILQHAKQPSVIDFDGLLAQLKATTNAQEARKLLVEAETGTRPHSYSSQLVCPTNFKAEWLPALTRITRRRKSYFLCLSFKLSLKPEIKSKRVYEVALDTGLKPIFSVYIADLGDSFSIENPIPSHLVNLNTALPKGAQPLFQRLVYSWCRETIEDFSNQLSRLASHVTVEELDLRKLNPQQRKNNWLIHLFRIYGITDWHATWLEQRLEVCDIPLLRVDSHMTSQRCHRCQYPYGQRQDSSYYCPRCGLEDDAHQNAAKNIYRRGQMKRNYSQRQD